MRYTWRSCIVARSTTLDQTLYQTTNTADGHQIRQRVGVDTNAESVLERRRNLQNIERVRSEVVDQLQIVVELIAVREVVGQIAPHHIRDRCGGVAER
ncbi:hypothetical protein WL21_04750 [Burkholderia ubonensis]|nr:hypothetical protein WJ81_15720 [Burkholderia ubonensis]KVZ57312.1 hypothetical protein WL20_23505 [Burkholderia ubonensis]KVZ73009.1 hypothetical protein WL21_04750 [Burkholderia ubonensis]